MSDQDKVSLKGCVKDEFNKTSKGKISRIIFFPFFRIVYDLKEAFSILASIVNLIYSLISKPISKKKTGIKTTVLNDLESEDKKNANSLMKNIVDIALDRTTVLFILNNVPFILIAYMVYNVNLPMLTKIIFVLAGVILLLTNIVIIKKAMK